MRWALNYIYTYTNPKPTLNQTLTQMPPHNLNSHTDEFPWHKNVTLYTNIVFFSIYIYIVFATDVKIWKSRNFWKSESHENVENIENLKILIFLKISKILKIWRKKMKHKMLKQFRNLKMSIFSPKPKKKITLFFPSRKQLLVEISRTIYFDHNF